MRHKLNFSQIAPGSLIVRDDITLLEPKDPRVGKYMLSTGLRKRVTQQRVPNQRWACVVENSGIVLMITIADADDQRFNFLALCVDGCGWGEFARTWCTWKDA